MWNNPKGKNISLKTALQCSPLFTQHAKRKVLLTAVVTKTLLPALFTILSSIHHHPELKAAFKASDNFCFTLDYSCHEEDDSDTLPHSQSPFYSFWAIERSCSPVAVWCSPAHLHYNTSASPRADRKGALASTWVSPLGNIPKSRNSPWKQSLPRKVLVEASPLLSSGPGLAWVQFQPRLFLFSPDPLIL